MSIFTYTWTLCLGLHTTVVNAKSTNTFRSDWFALLTCTWTLNLPIPVNVDIKDIWNSYIQYVVFHLKKHSEAATIKIKEDSQSTKHIATLSK